MRIPADICFDRQDYLLPAHQSDFLMHLTVDPHLVMCWRKSMGSMWKQANLTHMQSLHAPSALSIDGVLYLHHL